MQSAPATCLRPFRCSLPPRRTLLATRIEVAVALAAQCMAATMDGWHAALGCTTGCVNALRLVDGSAPAASAGSKASRSTVDRLMASAGSKASQPFNVDLHVLKLLGQHGSLLLSCDSPEFSSSRPRSSRPNDSGKLLEALSYSSMHHIGGDSLVLGHVVNPIGGFSGCSSSGQEVHAREG